MCRINEHVYLLQILISKCINFQWVYSVKVVHVSVMSQANYMLCIIASRNIFVKKAMLPCKHCMLSLKHYWHRSTIETLL